MIETWTSGIAYEQARNQHTLEGALVALPPLLDGLQVESLLDVGCGTGTWLRAALDMGIERVQGIDGVKLESADLHVDESLIRHCDFREAWNINERYDVVLCLEVAEHLEAQHAFAFVQKLTVCSDRIIFSAANPWQLGQHHVNCQWPAYWQGLFNQCGFACRDSLRWKIWDVAEIEPWYRQNVFLAERDECGASHEPRIPGVVHPDSMLTACRAWRSSQQSLVEAMARGVDRGIRKCLGVKCYE